MTAHNAETLEPSFPSTELTNDHPITLMVSAKDAINNGFWICLSKMHFSNPSAMAMQMGVQSANELRYLGLTNTFDNAGKK